MPRNDVLPFWTGVDSTMLTRASKLVSAATSFPVQYNKAIVGRNAFAHESGIHQDGMLKHTQTYEIMEPATVGVKQTSLVMGKHSGRHAFVHKLEELGYHLAGNQLEDAFVRFKTLADRKKHVYDEDIEALVDEEIDTAQDHIKLVSLSVIAGTRGPQRARDDEARHHRQVRPLRMRGQRPGRCGIQLHQGHGAARSDARALSGARGNRGHGRAGGGFCAFVRERPVRHRQRRRSRYAGGFRKSLSRSPQQADGPPVTRSARRTAASLDRMLGKAANPQRRRYREQDTQAGCSGLGVFISA